MTPAMLSGFGVYHGKQIGHYSGITYREIQALVDTPQRIDKLGAQWVIPSTLKTRVYKEQEQHGEYWMLWADLDTNPPAVDVLEALIASFGSDYEIYASRSATAETPKSRVLIPLVRAMSGADWKICQTLLNDRLTAAGMTPDRATQGTALPCFLPNLGEYYFSRSRRDGIPFDVITEWGEEIECKREAVALEIAQKQAEKEAREAERAIKQVDVSRSLIHSFNAAYEVEEILVMAGYDQQGDKFRHPNSKSGSFSANVKEGRVFTFSSADPLYTDRECAHDAFSAFTVLYAQGDINQALRIAGDSWLLVSGEPWNEVRRREQILEEFGPLTENVEEVANALVQNAQQSSTVQSEVPVAGVISRPENVPAEPFCLSQFALNGQSDSMQERMLSDTYVIGKIAILGQVTVIYAPPNAGKTLITIALLIETIKKKTIAGENVLYINADDNAKGLLQKLRLAEKYGFLMLAPGEMGYRLAQTEAHLVRMIEERTARGKVIVLDTVKKFTDIMDKKACSEFGKVIRAFVQSGGSVILLAHVNKHRDAEGNVVAAGTSDLIDDADCAYTVDVQSEREGQYLAIFENKKSRGDVDLTVAYRYTRFPGQDYEDLVDSVELVDQATLDSAKQAKVVEARLDANREAIEAITQVINAGFTTKTTIIKQVVDQSALGRDTVRRVLNQHTGANIVEGHRWECVVGDKNTHTYRMLPYMGGSLPAAKSRGAIPPPTPQTRQSSSLDEFEEDLLA